MQEVEFNIKNIMDSAWNVFCAIADNYSLFEHLSNT